MPVLRRPKFSPLRTEVLREIRLDAVAGTHMVRFSNALRARVKVKWSPSGRCRPATASWRAQSSAGATEVLQGDAADQLAKVSAGLDLLVCGRAAAVPCARSWSVACRRD
jgi:hypothetical protein